MAAVLENGLRTLLASYALNAKHGGGRLRLSARPIEGIVVNGLEPSGPVQFAVSDGRLALGNDAPGIVRSLVPALEGGPESPFEAWRQAYFPAAGSFVCVDLQGLQQVAVRHRGALIAALAARSHATPERVACDLDQVAALGSLFRGGFVTSTIRTDATAIQRRLGLLAREDRP